MSLRRSGGTIGVWLRFRSSARAAIAVERPRRFDPLVAVMDWPQTLCKRITNFDQLVWQDNRRGSPPPGAGIRSAAPRHERLTGHPSRTFPSLPVARVSIPPCRRPQQADAAGRKGTMAKEICISSTPHETRLAILEDDQLAEIYYERENEYTLAGSIYNGRVTRVLPGMQSAFVDIGLERDAFLYVTDFLELEDQEESDELEKAAASSDNQAPREVRHNNGQEREQQRPSQRPDRRPDRPGRSPRPTAEGALESADAEFTSPLEITDQSSDRSDGAQDSEGDPGAKRWRGRRRRRGGRGGGSSTQGETQEYSGNQPIEAPKSEPEVASEIQASELPSRAPRGERGGDRGGERAPAPFVLPGESLVKVRRPSRRSCAEGGNRSPCSPRAAPSSPPL